MKKAKIIVLAGQSNAVGVGHVKCLKRSFSDARIREYLKGYENIKINYCSHDKKSDGFVTTSTGCTEIHKDTIGPELGIAEYLNEKFPGEEFFIVKFAVGGATLKHDYLSPSSGGCYDISKFMSERENLVGDFLAGKPVTPGWCYGGLVSLLSDSISLLKENGRCPEIIGFCWMQGESDAMSHKDVQNYRTLFDKFINDFNSLFAEYIDNCIYADGGISEIWEYHSEMNAFKKEYAQKHKRFVFIDTIANGMTTQYEPAESPDIYHYDCESVIKLGKLFIKNIIEQKSI